MQNYEVKIKVDELLGKHIHDFKNYNLGTWKIDTLSECISKELGEQLSRIVGESYTRNPEIEYFTHECDKLQFNSLLIETNSLLCRKTEDTLLLKYGCCIRLVKNVDYDSFSYNIEESNIDKETKCHEEKMTAIDYLIDALAVAIKDGETSTHCYNILNSIMQLRKTK